MSAVVAEAGSESPFQTGQGLVGAAYASEEKASQCDNAARA